MREVPVKNLKPIPKLPMPVVHKSGIVLLQAGEGLDDTAIEELSDNGVESVYFLEAEERLDEIRRDLTHVAMPLSDLTPGDTLTRSVYDNKGHLLLEEGTAIPQSFAESMRRRGMDAIYFRKPAEQMQPKVARKIRAAIEEGNKGGGAPALVDRTTVKELQTLEMEMAAADDLNEDKLRAKIDAQLLIEVAPDGPPFAERMTDARNRAPATEKEKRSFTSAVESSLNDLREIYARLGRGDGKTCTPLIDRVATSVMSGMIQNRELITLLGTDSSTSSPEEYLCSHSLATTLVAVNVGSALRYGPAQIKSLAYGAMLADVGMLKVPENIVAKADRLSPQEFAEVKCHPSYGLDMLQRITSIPDAVPYIVYQSHERANGSGYPCGKKDVVIHTFAKIVGISDIYTSLCADRPYRPAKLPYEAMEQLVLMCGRRLLDSAVVKAFLSCNSMFPVGSFVRLNDGQGGRVIAASPADYMRPLLSLLTNAGNKPLEKPVRYDLLENKDIQVSQAIARKDLPITSEDPMLGF